MFFRSSTPHLVPLIDPTKALSGREESISPGDQHLVFEAPFSHYDCNRPPSSSLERIIIGMGCFWGAERLFWQRKGVVFTSVGYAGGFTPNPNYEEVCSGLTGHSEVVQIDFNPQEISLREILKCFWERHDPTQGMRQGNDIGTQYRSVIYFTEASQESIISDTRRAFTDALQREEGSQAMGSVITTEISALAHYYYAEAYHQQYLHRNPNGYCGLKGTGAVCIITS